MSTKAKKTERLRQVLIILSNRLNRLQKPRFLEVTCDDKGGIHSEKPLRSEPKKAVYDEVWENDEGKTDFASCHRFSRKYGHKLQKK
jgi:hypothetical protein